ncbi:thioesterase-like family protein [Leptospira weilii serovar Ranarum str. ICFT]|uniref:Thioesterase-like family protein n=1 Tax=Leptospira weilii serovar Ranarum str. ICFT TaxID=1218598 RepID=N1WUU9_9LEPT|nr:acyl-CoA thioesterase [Leptospira weilii]EMY79653.1 thioesterase-like family protein [Leptospira weilii serovar Ranarum str. ICFT]
MIKNTKIHLFEISIADHHCDGSGSLNLENAQSFLDEARTKALREIELNSASSDLAHIEPIVLWSESDYRDRIHFPDSILVQTEFRTITNARYRIIQKLIRKSDRKVVCNSNSFCILFDSNRKRPWKQSVSLRAV